GKKSAQIREILISESAWEEMTCLFAPSLDKSVSPLAIRYEQKRMSKSHTFSKASVNCLKVGSPVAFVGVLFALLGIKIRRRVRFLESN
ncbi:hypothetical protein LPD76_21410, partial [Enterobacter hormaechei]|nr:hypothetical protein [Enterobacter hormaechei]